MKTLGKWVICNQIGIIIGSLVSMKISNVSLENTISIYLAITAGHILLYFEIMWSKHSKKYNQ